MLYRLSSITPARYCSLDSTEDCCLSAGQRAQQGRLAGSLLAYVLVLPSVVGLSSLGEPCTM